MKRWRPMWTLRQRVVLIALLLLCLSVFVLGVLWPRQRTITDPPTDGPRANELVDRLDPNSADAAALSCIPTLGEKRASDIVDYRQTFIAQHPGQSAFTTPADLTHIKGIGAATVENMKPFMTFPALAKKSLTP